MHKGIATRTFERKFNWADHVEVAGAKLENGLLFIKLEKEIPEAMRPKTISIDTANNVVEAKKLKKQAEAA